MLPGTSSVAPPARPRRPQGPRTARLSSALTSSSAAARGHLPLPVLVPEPELLPPLRFERLRARRPARPGKVPPLPGEAPPPGDVPGQRDLPTLPVLPDGPPGVQTRMGAETPVTGWTGPSVNERDHPGPNGTPVHQRQQQQGHPYCPQGHPSAAPRGL